MQNVSIGASNLAVLAINVGASSSPRILSVTGSVNGAYIEAAVTTSPPRNSGIFYKPNPIPGAETITVALSSTSTACLIGSHALSVQNTTPESAIAVNKLKTSDTIEFALNVSAGAVVVACSMLNQTNRVPVFNTGGVLRYNPTVDVSSAGGASYPPAAASGVQSMSVFWNHISGEGSVAAASWK
jgi:hypothetical protein